jgi:hypothetical protein
MPFLIHPTTKPVKVYRSAEEWLAKEHGVGLITDSTQEQSAAANNNTRLSGQPLKRNEVKES